MLLPGAVGHPPSPDLEGADYQNPKRSPTTLAGQRHTQESKDAILEAIVAVNIDPSPRSEKALGPTRSTDSPLLLVGTVENPGALKRMRQAVDFIGPDGSRFKSSLPLPHLLAHATARRGRRF